MFCIISMRIHLAHFSHLCARLSYYRTQTIYEYKMLARACN